MVFIQKHSVFPQRDAKMFTYFTAHYGAVFLSMVEIITLGSAGNALETITMDSSLLPKVTKDVQEDLFNVWRKSETMNCFGPYMYM